jgi:hypothetical protein
MICNITWLQASDYKKGMKLIPSGIKKNYNKIKNLNKNIKIKTWDNEDIINLINIDYKEYLDLYKKITDLRFKSDLARMLILYKFGGIYIDIDQECLVDFNKFGINDKTKLVLGKSLENNRVSNGFIYVKNINNSFIKECIDEYVSNLKQNYNYSGCQAINNILNKYPNLDLLLLTENCIKKEEECSSITEFYLSFYFFNSKGEKIMRSRYPNYYADKEISNFKQLETFN